MTATNVEIRRGNYYDSLVLMQLQLALTTLPGVIDAGVMMGTEANKSLLVQSDLLPPDARTAGADDLLIVVRATDEAAAVAALEQVDVLLASRRKASSEGDYRPRSLESALRMLPDAAWLLVSVPGRYAGRIAREALEAGKNVFLYSDNVPIEEELSLKELAAARDLLLMGPDCGTAIVNGVGFGFANRVRRGNIGLVAASGTGLQAVSAAIHNLGGGISHALGTGGRDLSEPIGGRSARQALSLLADDPETSLIVLISKPPAAPVAESLLQLARRAGKPVVVDFIGYSPPARRIGNLHFTTSFDEAARLAVHLSSAPRPDGPPPAARPFAASQRYLRALFSGGTLAYEALLLLSGYLPGIYSNVPFDEQYRLPDPAQSQAHTIIDLGADDFTVGRLHPMIDNDLRLRRLEQEARDPEVALLLLDVVLGDGAHPDPAGQLAPAIAAARRQAAGDGRHLEVVALVVGTDEDPQDLEQQIARLREAGAHVERSNEAAAHYVGQLLDRLRAPEEPGARGMSGALLSAPVAAINVGLESFAQSLEAQGAAVLHVDWRPPAGGNERLQRILERMKGR